MALAHHLARAIVRALERAQPDPRNLFVTVDELARDSLVAKPRPRPRVRRRGGPRAGDRHPRGHSRVGAAARGRVCRAGVDAAGRCVVAGAGGARRIRHLGRVASPNAGAGERATAGERDGSTAGVHRLEETTTVDPDQVQAVEGSAAGAVDRRRRERVTVEHDGRSARADTRRRTAASPIACTSTTTGYLAVIAGDGAPADAGGGVARCAADGPPDGARTRSRCMPAAIRASPSTHTRPTTTACGRCRCTTPR